MLRELFEIIKDFFIRLFQSRLFAVGVILTALFGVLLACMVIYVIVVVICISLLLGGNL